MDNELLLKNIRLIREKANNNKLVIFVGAGASKNVDGLPDWNELVMKMAESINYCNKKNCIHRCENCYRTCEEQRSYSTDELMKIPQYVYNKDPELYRKVLQDNIKHVDVKSPISDVIGELSPVHIITTNYDKLLENSDIVKQCQYEVIVYDKDLLNSKGNKYIIKMHGDIDDLDSIILKEADYLEYSQKHILIETFIKSLLADHTIMFIGYSLNDYNIKLIISWINYIRSQNSVFNNDTKFGYIVIDNEDFSDTEKVYFEKNNIGVININTMPLISKIPKNLTNEIGKRLFSFLKTIQTYALDKNLGEKLVFDRAIELMKKYNYINYTALIKVLCLEQFYREQNQLIIFTATGYDSLVHYLNANNDNSEFLLDVFSNCGIESLELVDNSPTIRRKKYNIPKKEKFIYKDKLYKLYVSNKYDQLLSLSNENEEDIINSCFYSVLVKGYSRDIYDKYLNLNFQSLPNEKKHIYLFNNEVLNAIDKREFSAKAIKRYINNIYDAQEKEILQYLLDIHTGNAEMILQMMQSLEKLKEQYHNRNHNFLATSSLREFHKIKNIALEHYMFYFCNHLFFEGFIDFKRFLSYYIEAIILTNGQIDEDASSNPTMYTRKEKYKIDKYDIDILTKYISIKELYNLIDEYQVESFAIDDSTINHIIECFENINLSQARLFDLKLQYRLTNISIKCMLLLCYIELSTEQKETISELLDVYFGKKEVVEFIFSTNCPEWRMSLKIINKILRKVPVKHNIGIVNNIINSKDFWEYYANSNKYELSLLMDKFISCEKIEEVQEDINSLINSYEGKQKIDIIKLLKNNLLDSNTFEFKKYVADNFKILENDDIIDLSFSKWINLSEEDVNKMIDDTIELYDKQKKSPFRIYPDPIENNIELLSLLYITNDINDLSKLKDIKGYRDYFDFLLDPEAFDYSKVDFSHYMWENMVYREKFMDMFIAKKKYIIPKIQKRVQLDTATELERKILYGLFLDKKELI